MKPHSCTEKENFLRFCLLVINNANAVVICLLEFSLKQQHLTFEQFLIKHQHDIYHLCYAGRKCCKCIKDRSKRRSTSTRSILSKVQIDVLYTESLCQNNCGIYCCNRLQPKQCINPSFLDLTIAKCLLTSFCSDIFWYCCLQLRNKNMQEFLDEKKHIIYHLKFGSRTCCLCKTTTSFSISDKSDIINKEELLFLYKVTNTSHPQSKCCSNHSIRICELSANNLSPSSIEDHVAFYIQQHCCETRKALEVITDIRNTCYAHPKEAVLSNNEFETKKEKLIGAILTLADVCGIKEKAIADIETSMNTPLDGSQMQSILMGLKGKIDEMCDDLPKAFEKILQDHLKVVAISEDQLKTIIDTINTNFRQLEQTDQRNRIVTLSSNTNQDCGAMTPKVDDVYIIFQQLTTFLHEKEAKDIKEDGEHVTRVFKDLFERVNKFDSLNFSMYPITDAFEKIEMTKKTTCKLSESINDLKNNLKRRDFRKFMIYVNVFLCLGVIRKEIFIQIYNSFKMCTLSKYERQIEKYSERIQHLYGIEKERDRELLSTFVKIESKSAVVNFMYNACDWLLVDRVLANSYSCRELTEDGSFVPTDSEYTIECAAFIGSKAYMANLWGSFLILSRHENLQSRFKFTQKDIAGKKFFTIYSNLWPSYHVKMRLGKITGWCVHGKHDDPHDSGTWSIRAVKYRDDTFYLLSPRKSKAVFMCADMSGRIYGNMKQVDAYCLWSIKQVKTR